MYYNEILPGTIHSGTFNQRVSVFQIELRERVRQRFEALKEGVNVGSLGLYPSYIQHKNMKKRPHSV